MVRQMPYLEKVRVSAFFGVNDKNKRPQTEEGKGRGKGDFALPQ